MTCPAGRTLRALATGEAASPESLKRALSYPYDIPRHSFVFDPTTGTTRHLADESTDAGWIRGRVPILAVGSNAAPEQLMRKFGNVPGDADPIYSVLAQVRDRDVVYAARVSSYGSVPATLVESPGTIVELHVNFLTSAQRERMDRSESLGSGYALESVPRDLIEIDVELEHDLDAYVATAGPLRIDGHPIALTAVPARNRRFQQWDEPQVLEHVAERSGLALPIWLGRLMTDSDYLQKLRVALHEWSKISD